MIGDENEIDGESFWSSEKLFWELFGEGLIDKFLESLVVGQCFEDGGGDGSVVGRSCEVTAGGKDGLDATKCAKQDVDEDWVVTFCSMILFFEQFCDKILEVGFDNFVTIGKIFL